MTNILGKTLLKNSSYPVLRVFTVTGGGHEAKILTTPLTRNIANYSI